MTKREKLTWKLNAIYKKLDVLNEQHIEIKKQLLLLSDDKQQYSEKLEVYGRGKNKKEYLIGRIHWKEDFVDEDNPKNVVTVDRSRIVRENGEWL